MPDRTVPLAAFLLSAALTDPIDGIDDGSCDFDEIREFSPDIAVWNPGDLPCRNHLAWRLANLVDSAATCAGGDRDRIPGCRLAAGRRRQPRPLTRRTRPPPPPGK